MHYSSLYTINCFCIFVLHVGSFLAQIFAFLVKLLFVCLLDRIYLLSLILNSNIFSNSLPYSRVTPTFSGLLPNCLSRIFLLNPLSSFILGFNCISSGVHLEVTILFPPPGILHFHSEMSMLSILLISLVFCWSPDHVIDIFRKAAWEGNISGSFMSACIFTYSDGQFYVSV